jgi:sulfatase maturation enzyme AslB (radical SAM superfamily)
MSKIESLSLILSCGCNLSCEYCLIAKSINENSKNIQEKTREYLKNG